MRVGTALVFLLATVCAHGGANRPAPGRAPDDPPYRTGTKNRLARKERTGARTGIPLMDVEWGQKHVAPWSSWWAYNRRILTRPKPKPASSSATSPKEELPFDRKKLREETLLPILLESLRDEEEEVRAAAAVILGKIEAPAARDRLVEFLAKERKRPAREGAMLGLLLLKDPTLKPFLKRAVENKKEEHNARGFAVLALGLLGEREYLWNVVEQKKPRLRGSNTEVMDLQACGVIALGFAGGADDVPRLIKLLGNRYAPDAARGYVGTTLRRLARKGDVVPDLMRVLKSRSDKKGDRGAKAGAAIALGGRIAPDDEKTLKTLRRMIWHGKDRFGGLRTMITLCLGSIGGELATRHLIEGHRRCIIDKRHAERPYYLLALAACGGDKALAIIRKDLAELKNERARAAAAIALALAKDKEAPPLLRKQLERDRQEFIPHGMIALAMLGDKKSLPLIEKLLDKRKESFVLQEGSLALALLSGRKAVPKLLQLYARSRSRFEWGAVAQALALVGDETAVEPLLRILKDKDRKPEERAIALAALGRMADENPTPVLSRFAQHLNLYAASPTLAELLQIL